MRETGFFTRLCCWTSAADDGNCAQTAQQAQSASGGEVTGVSADSEPLLQSPSIGQAGLSVLDSASNLSNHRNTSGHGQADIPLKGILKKPCEKLSCEEPSDKEPWQTESVGSDGRGHKEVSFEPMMEVYRIEPRNASMKVKQICIHTSAYRHMLKSEAREEQTSEAKVNARKNSAISEQGQKLRKLLRSRGAVRAGVARGRPCQAPKHPLVRVESGSTKTSGAAAQTDQ